MKSRSFQKLTTTAILLLVFVFGCAKSEKLVAPAPDTSGPLGWDTASPKLVPIDELPERIAEFRGKIVFVDLWAMW